MLLVMSGNKEFSGIWVNIIIIEISTVVKTREQVVTKKNQKISAGFLADLPILQLICVFAIFKWFPKYIS